MRKLLFLTVCAVMISSTIQIKAQGTKEDYQRADQLKKKFSDKTFFDKLNINWVDSSNILWYSVNTLKGKEYFLVDADKASRKPAFNQEKFAKNLGQLIAKEVDAFDLPVRNLEFIEEGKAISFTNGKSIYKCELKKYKIEKINDLPERRRNSGYWGRGRNELDNDPVISPDSLWEAQIKDFDIYIVNRENKEETRLSWDGSEGEYYSSYVYWSPDSKKLLANKYTPGFTRKVHYIESSPEDQVQPKHSEIQYTKPGDRLPHLKPTLFHIDEKKQILVSDDLYPEQFSLKRFNWREDSRAITFEYNQRGHQLYRVIELDARTGKTSILVNEACETFFHYSGKKFRKDLNDGEEIIWASERDGWNHLYLIDGKNGNVKQQITKGNWLVRNVIYVDEEARTILFAASGREPGDPYLLHYYRINIDGTGLRHLTPADGQHKINLSANKDYFTDTWSKVDQAPETVLRRVSDGSVVMNLEKADISELKETGWKAPEVFMSKGRDDKTDIWGIIVRPSNFNSNNKYPVIEYIYAGPHSSFVPKTFRAYQSMQSLAELGFIVVQCDGMGTSNRSKAFHDVCWQNLGDAGFPDRIKWITAASEKYSNMDISKVGIYGTSAGGQSSAGAVLFHPEFYTVAVSSCGCHDNRMDKIWWNEQWMGYPIGPHYSRSSNVDNAHLLQGKLMLIVGEMDKNVDPASTYQVVDALIKANKDFDLLVVPGMGHSSGGKYGEHKRRDFFVKNLLGIDPPAWSNK